MAKGRKKHRTHVTVADQGIPKSFVIKSGEVGQSLARLVRDVRQVMEPNTAARLKERRGNRLKDFVQVAGQLSVTHMLVFSRSASSGIANLRVGRFPRGPTASFHVTSYSLAKDVRLLQSRPRSPGSEFLKSPLVVLNNLNADSKHMQLVTTLLQNMFPTIKVQKMRLEDAKRVVLFNYNKETDRIEFRHYCVAIKTTGISKSVKSIMHAQVPDLNAYGDISDFIMRGAFASESDVEDAAESTVTLPDSHKAEKRAIKLVELGPRMELQLVKIQAGLCGGEVIHHSFVAKSTQEAQLLEDRATQREEERNKRIAEAKNKKDNAEMDQD